MKKSSKAPNQALKRITLPVSDNIAFIRDQLMKDTGVKMTYNQTVNFLIHFYVTRSSTDPVKLSGRAVTKPVAANDGKPRTQWGTL